MQIPNRAFLPIAAIYLVASASAQIRSEVAPAGVIVNTTPGAKIFLDNVLAGEASSNGAYVIHNVKPGAHTLHVAMHGKRTFTQTIVVAAGKVSTVRAELAELTGDLEILTVPDAEILLDGKPAGKADGDGRLLIRGLNDPPYKVRVTRAGYNPEEREVNLVPDIVSSVTIDLKAITAVPENAPASAPNYTLQRRLFLNENAVVNQAFFEANSLKLVSVSHQDQCCNGEDPTIVEWDAGTGRLLKKVDVKAFYGIHAVSPDLRWVAVEIKGDLNTDTAEYEESTQLVEAGSGRVVGEWPGTGSFTPDSKQLIITAQYDRELFFWDLESGKKVKTWRDPSVGWMLYSPNGQLVASNIKGVTIRNADTGKVIQRLATSEPYRPVAFSPDGRWLAIMADTKIELWETAAGRQGRTIESSLAPNGELKFTGAVFTPDSRYLISIMSGNNGEVRVWDTLSGLELRRWPATWPRSIALSADGRWLAVVGRDLTLWKRAE